ncbi:MAG: hypothetical protein HFI05_01340 [Lachnospiraceae bacterium]|nr:hypothetical protein [Lachnospiraceae bacterium]
MVENRRDYNKVKTEFPEIGLATVYQTLQVFFTIRWITKCLLG